MSENMVLLERASPTKDFEDVIEAEILTKGWMWKTPPINKLKSKHDWRRRYFKLLRVENQQSLLLLHQGSYKKNLKKVKEKPFCGYCLVYWSTKEHCVRPLRVIQLHGCTIKTSNDVHWNDFPHLLCLDTEDRTFFLSPENEEAHSLWLDYLNEAICLANSDENPVYQSVTEIRRQLSISSGTYENSCISECSGSSTSLASFYETATHDSAESSDSDSYYSNIDETIRGNDFVDSNNNGNDYEYEPMAGLTIRIQKAGLEKTHGYDSVSPVTKQRQSDKFCHANECHHNHLIPPKEIMLEEKPPIIPRTRRPPHPAMKDAFSELLYEDISSQLNHVTHEINALQENGEESFYESIGSSNTGLYELSNHVTHEINASQESDEESFYESIESSNTTSIREQSNTTSVCDTEEQHYETIPTEGLYKYIYSNNNNDSSDDTILDVDKYDRVSDIVKTTKEYVDSNGYTICCDDVDKYDRVSDIKDVKKECCDSYTSYDKNSNNINTTFDENLYDTVSDIKKTSNECVDSNGYLVPVDNIFGRDTLRLRRNSRDIFPGRLLCNFMGVNKTMGRLQLSAPRQRKSEKSVQLLNISFAMDL